MRNDCCGSARHDCSPGSEPRDRFRWLDRRGQSGVANIRHDGRCRWRAIAVALVAVLALVAAGCGSSSSSSTPSAATGASSSSSTSPGSSSTASTSTSSCGPKPGVKATGTPINVGTIDTKQPGTDFSDGPNMIAAYFACVNANGGVDGHPLKLFVEYDQTQPAQVAAAAKKLIQSDHVVAIDGVFDLLECTVNQGYWKQLGIYEMGAGIAPECWSTPNSAAVNMGPRYSSDGAVQYGLSQHPSKIVFSAANVPGVGYAQAGPQALAAAAHMPITVVPENVPINDGNSVALDLVNKAGSNGWVVLDYTRLEALAYPPGRAEARPRGPGQGLGLLDTVQHRLPGQDARDRSGTTSCSSTPS